MAGGYSGTGPLRKLGTWCARHAWWIVAFWIAVVGMLNIVVPQLEQTVSERSAPFLPGNLPSVDALRDMSTDFGSPPSTAVGHVVLASETSLGEAEGQYYSELVDALLADRTDVAYILDTYGNPVTRDISVSPDGKALNLMVVAEGDVGSTRAHHSTLGIREIIDSIPKPAGLQAYYTGASPTLADLFSSIDYSLLIITAVSVVLITALLLLAYRSFVTALIPLLTIAIALAAARPVVSALGMHDMLPVSNFTIALMTAMVLGAGTDYAIFLVAGFHDARRAKQNSDDAVATASAKVSGILIASALTIAAAACAMIFTQVGMFKTAGPPTAIGIGITLAVSLTLTPALLAIAGRRGLIEPKRSTERRWRRLGARVIRRAGPLTALALAFLLGISLLIPTFTVNFDENAMQLRDTGSAKGYDEVLDHYGVNEVLPEYLVIRADHDLRNTGDLAALEMAAMSVSNLPDIAYVRSITRPDGKPLPEAAIGTQTKIVGDGLGDAHRQLVDAAPELRRLATGVTQLRDGAGEAQARMPELVAGTQQVVGMADGVLAGLETATRIATIASDGRSTLPDGIAQLSTLTGTLGALIESINTSDVQTGAVIGQLGAVFDPLLEPLPGPGCVADPNCLRARTAFAELDRATGGRAAAALRQSAALAGVPDVVLAKAQALLPELQTGLVQLQSMVEGLGGRTPEQLRADLDRLSSGVTELSTGMTTLADGLRQVKDGTDTTVRLTGQLAGGLAQASDYLAEMSKHTSYGPGAGFYLPAQGFSDPRFVEGSKLLISPNGKTARMLVVRSINPYGDVALDNVGLITDAARAGLNGTVLADAEVSSTGLTSLSADMNEQVKRDFALFASVAVLAVFLILALLLRSLLAPALLVGAVVLSFGTAIGTSILVWQHIIGINLDWSVMPISFMALVAVGADYSMLFASKIRDESSLGMRRGIVRAFGTTGSVITTAGIVFAITMFALMSGTVVNLLQIGFTVGVGLLLDVAIVRTVLVPAAMSLLGNRVWWPSRA